MSGRVLRTARPIANLGVSADPAAGVDKQLTKGVEPPSVEGFRPLPLRELGGWREPGSWRGWGLYFANTVGASKTSAAASELAIYLPLGWEPAHLAPGLSFADTAGGDECLDRSTFSGEFGIRPGGSLPAFTSRRSDTVSQPLLPAEAAHKGGRGTAGEGDNSTGYTYPEPTPFKSWGHLHRSQVRPLSASAAALRDARIPAWLKKGEASALAPKPSDVPARI
jgi:hypothetical protein